MNLGREDVSFFGKVSSERGPEAQIYSMLVGAVIDGAYSNEQGKEAGEQVGPK